ncbi:hypothetical protein MKZ07_18380 [Paenibacillus sp. FSL P4-0338]|uniref:hypothetical protein n=1 Tax=Paenibacillus sp. FSL P4-0338 TaxID=2921635 RepID=UPI0030F622DC
MAAQFEEIIMNADLFDAQQPAPDLCQLLFSLVTRAFVPTLHLAQIGFRQLLAVDLSVWR